MIHHIFSYKHIITLHTPPNNQHFMRDCVTRKGITGMKSYNTRISLTTSLGFGFVKKRFNFLCKGRACVLSEFSHQYYIDDTKKAKITKHIINVRYVFKA